jgi:hypothetical protein
MGLGRHRYVTRLAFGMAASANGACVRVLARSHAVIAAISSVRPRRTTADSVRAFVSYTVCYRFWHDLIILHITYYILHITYHIEELFFYVICNM